MPPINTLVQHAAKLGYVVDFAHRAHLLLVDPTTRKTWSVACKYVGAAVHETRATWHRIGTDGGLSSLATPEGPFLAPGTHPGINP
jgi:hypothetical protein